MPGLFITFEGTEGSGKSTQIALLAERIREFGRSVLVLREPGGTPIGEEIRHTLKHSASNMAMTPEAELLLMNASRAQLVREVIRPALQEGQVVLCDRFYDSTTAYQGFGRGLDLETVRRIIDFAVGPTRPHLTFVLHVPVSLSEARRRERDAASPPQRDRIEAAGEEFFRRVEQGFQAIAMAEPERIRWLEASLPIDVIAGLIWQHIKPIIAKG